VKTPLKVVIVALLLAAVGVIVGMKISKPDEIAVAAQATSPPMLTTPKAPETSPAISPVALPHLIDLGADKCIPCKAMAPILAQLRQDFDGQFNVTFIDVWKDRAAGEHYGVQMIPTQIFLDPTGKELFRHTGFYSRDEILAQWRELGYDFHAKVVAP